MSISTLYLKPSGRLSENPTRTPGFVTSEIDDDPGELLEVQWHVMPTSVLVPSQEQDRLPTHFGRSAAYRRPEAHLVDVRSLFAITSPSVHSARRSDQERHPIGYSVGHH